MTFPYSYPLLVMKGKKLYLILSAFSDKEMQAFCDFVQSPYFNKNAHLISFAAHLAELHPHYGESPFEKEQLPADLIPDETLTDKRISYLISGLQQLVERFLVIDRLQDKTYTQEYVLINALRAKNLRELYLPRIKKLQKTLDSPPEYHREQLTVRFMLSDVVADIGGAKIESMESSLQTATDHLFELYLVNILRFAYKDQNRQGIQFLNPTSIPLLNELEPYFQEYRDRNPLILLYHQLYCCVREPEKDHYFDELCTLLPQYQHMLGDRQLRIIYLATINISLRMMRSKPDKYTQTTLDLYTEGIDNRALLENNNLSQWAFNNTVKLAIRAQRLDWVENFIQNYQQLLLKQDRKNATGLNQAELAFARGDFHGTLAYLNDVSTTSIRYHILVSILRIKSFWELQEMKPAIAALSAFKVYLSRTRGIAPPLKKGAQNFCQLLHRISVGGSKKKRLETKEQITQTALLIDKQWLIKTFQKENPKL